MTSPGTQIGDIVYTFGVAYALSAADSIKGVLLKVARKQISEEDSKTNRMHGFPSQESTKTWPGDAIIASLMAEKAAEIVSNQIN